MLWLMLSSAAALGGRKLRNALIRSYLTTIGHVVPSKMPLSMVDLDSKVRSRASCTRDSNNHAGLFSTWKSTTQSPPSVIFTASRRQSLNPSKSTLKSRRQSYFWPVYYVFMWL